jgi:hypothetical protein
MGHWVSVAGLADVSVGERRSAGARPGQDEGLEEIEVAWGVPADGEVASELAAVLGPVVHDVSDDKPPRLSRVAVRQRLVQFRVVEGLHVGPEADVLLEAERVEANEREEAVAIHPLILGLRPEHEAGRSAQ